MDSFTDASRAVADATVRAVSDATVRAVVIDSASLFRRRVITVSCAVTTSMHDVKLLLQDEAVFANEVVGTQWVRAVDGQGHWMERAALLTDVSGQLVGPALRTTDINPTMTLGEFLQAARRVPGGDVVHVIIYVPTAQLPRCYDSVVAGLVRLKVTSPRTAASTVAAGTVDHHDANQFGDATLPVSVAGYFNKDVYRRYADAVVLNMLKDEYAKSREEERQLRVSLVGSPGVGSPRSFSCYARSSWLRASKRSTFTA